MTEHVIPTLDKKGLRSFGITTGGMIALLFGLFFPWLFEANFPKWPWIVFGVLAAWGLIAPLTLRPVYNAWMKLAILMSKVMTPLVLGIVFYGVVMPMGFIMRLFGNDPMRRKLIAEEQTYRVPSEKAPTDRLERPF